MIKTTTKSGGLEESLVQMMLKDGLKAGDAILSEHRLAALFGFSRGTVRQAISKLVDKGVLRSEQGRGAFLVKAPELETDKARGSRLIGLVCWGGIDNPFAASVARGVEEGAAQIGMHLCVGSATGGPKHEAEIVRGFLQRGVDGLIISPTATNPPSPFLLELCRGGANVVVLGDIPGIAAPVAATDNREGAFIATAALLDAGHRRVAHLRGPSRNVEAVARFDSYRLALERAGLEFRPELAPSPDPLQGYSEELGRAAMAKLLALPQQERPTAVFAANDTLALGAWDVLKKHGLSVPGDVSLIGFGNLRAPYERGLLLSSVEEHPRALGAAAWDLLRRLLEGDTTARSSRVLLRPELILRSSIGKPKEALP